jgi:hypothetical protein
MAYGYALASPPLTPPAQDSRKRRVAPGAALPDSRSRLNRSSMHFQWATSVADSSSSGFCGRWPDSSPAWIGRLQEARQVDFRMAGAERPGVFESQSPQVDLRPHLASRYRGWPVICPGLDTAAADLLVPHAGELLRCAARSPRPATSPAPRSCASSSLCIGEALGGFWGYPSR